MYRVTVLLAVQRMMACRDWFATSAVSESTTSESDASTVVPATAESTKDVMELLTVSPHVPLSSPVVGSASLSRLVCDVDTGCVVEDQATVLNALRRASTLESSDAARASTLAKARRACDRFARTVQARLDASRIAGDSLSPSLPQCRIAAWLGKNLRESGHRLTAQTRAQMDGLSTRLARRYTVAAERSMAQIADRLPEVFDPVILREVDALLSTCELKAATPSRLQEIAILLVV